MRLLTITFVLTVLSNFSISAQSAGNILYNVSNRWSMDNEVVQRKAVVGNMNQVTFDINTMFNVKADSYLAIFHITQIGSDARQADSLMNRRLDNFRRDVTSAGIPNDNFIIDMLSMVPIYEVDVVKRLFSKSFTEIPAGFEIQKNIHIKFDNAQVLDKIITSAAINEIYDLIKVDYHVANQEAVYDSLRSVATELVMKRMSQFEELGIEFEDQWRMANDQIGVFFPLDRYESYQAFAYSSVDASRKRSQVTQMRKPKTFYYNKISYANYDAVINPEIIEPAVQFTYNIQIAFTIEKKKEVVVPEPIVKIEEKTKYILLSEGDIKQVELK